MVKIPIEVCNGRASFDVTVQAESIKQAVNLVRRRYPGSDVRLKFPIDPNVFWSTIPLLGQGSSASRSLM